MRKRQRLGLVVGDEDRGLAKPSLQLAQFLAHLHAELEVEAGEGLVEQQERRLEDQRAGERSALLLAARQLVRPAVAKLGEADQLEHRRRAPRHFAPRNAMHGKSEGDVVAHRQMRKESRGLEDQANLPLVRRHLLDAPSGQLDRARIDRLEAGDAAERRRLAAAARSEEGKKFALRNRK